MKNSLPCVTLFYIHIVRSVIIVLSKSDILVVRHLCVRKISCGPNLDPEIILCDAKEFLEMMRLLPELFWLHDFFFF